MNYRKAEEKDIVQLVHLRKAQLMDEGSAPIHPIDAELYEYFKSSLKDGSFISWIAEENDVIIATSGISFYQLPPYYTNPTGKNAYVTNMYTKDEYRRRGIASKLLNLVLEEARTRGYQIVRLHASKQGKSMYEKFGFKDSEGYMSLHQH